MQNISVAEILKMHGKWIEASKFALLVADKLKVSERHAYNLVKKAANDAKVLRFALQNRSVLYGLPEFGPPKEQMPLSDAVWKEHTLQQFSRIRNMINSPHDHDVVRVPEETLLTAETLLPEDMKRKLKPEIDKLRDLVAEAYKLASTRRLDPISIRKSTEIRSLYLIAIAHERVPRVLEKIFALLRDEK